MVIVRIVGYIFLALFVFLLLIGMISFGIVLTQSKTACADAHTLSTTTATSTVPHRDEIFALPNYTRDEQITFLRFPEWYIVYSAREYASFISASGTPSSFPYNEATAQYWCSYELIKK